MENDRGNKLSSAKVWNTLKTLEKVTQHGHVTSYKDFNYTQYLESKKYLEKWAKEEQMPSLSKLNFKGSELFINDGDTFTVAGQKYRLWGVDTFEMQQNCWDAGGQPYKCGESAKQALIEIVKDKSVKCEKRADDRYGRIVAKCVVGGESLGSLLALSGWAMDFTQYSKGRFKQQEQEAQAAKRGAWVGRGAR